jgi:hypothetical protein
MALSDLTTNQSFTLANSTFTNLGGAVSDIFAGFGAKAQADLAAQGLTIQAFGTRQQTALQKQGMDISAQGIETQATGLRIKAQGDIAEGQEYDLAAALARKNEDYVRESEAIQSMQLDREIAGTMGTQIATAGGSGLKVSGSVIDMLADSHAQGALAHAVLEKQSNIQVEAYDEQAKSYDVMSGAARMAATGEKSIADAQDKIADETRGLGVETARIGSITADAQEGLAAQTKAAGDQAATGDFVGSLLKGAAAIAPFAIAAL